MYLMKCSCGCHATLGDDYFARRRVYKCQNCEKQFNLRYDADIASLKSIFEESEFKRFIIPNDTRIEFNFDSNTLG